MTYYFTLFFFVKRKDKVGQFINMRARTDRDITSHGQIVTLTNKVRKLLKLNDDDEITMTSAPFFLKSEESPLPSQEPAQQASIFSEAEGKNSG